MAGRRQLLGFAQRNRRPGRRDVDRFQVSTNTRGEGAGATTAQQAKAQQSGAGCMRLHEVFPSVRSGKSGHFR